MACLDYPGNPDAGSCNWYQSTRLKRPVQRSVHVGEENGGWDLRTFAEACRFPFAPLCGYQRYLGVSRECMYNSTRLNVLTEQKTTRVRQSMRRKVMTREGGPRPR